MEFSALQIATILNGEVVGNSDVTVAGLAKIEEGTTGTLSPGDRRSVATGGFVLLSSKRRFCTREDGNGRADAHCPAQAAHGLCYVDRFHVAQIADAVRAEFATVAGFLDPAKGQTRIGACEGVDEARAGFQTIARDGFGAFVIFAAIAILVVAI